MRFIRNTPFLPIGYIKHKSPMMKRNAVNAYTEVGRKEIHKNLATVDISVLRFLMQNPIPQRSVEYNDNRLALYSGQRGRCKVTDEELNPFRVHCHHIIPRAKGGTDEYKNLVLVDQDIHILIHAKEEETISRFKHLVTNTANLNKLNTLRKKLELKTI